MNFKSDPTLLDAGDLILLFSLPKTMDIGLYTRIGPFSLGYLAYGMINRTEFCECSFFCRTILPDTNNIVMPKQCSRVEWFV